MSNDMIYRGMKPMVKIDEYKGTCHHCQQPIQYSNFVVLLLHITSENTYVVCPLEMLLCPHCRMLISTINITGTHIGNTVLKEGPARLN